MKEQKFHASTGGSHVDLQLYAYVIFYRQSRCLCLATSKTIRKTMDKTPLS